MTQTHFEESATERKEVPPHVTIAVLADRFTTLGWSQAITLHTLNIAAAIVERLGKDAGWVDATDFVENGFRGMEYSEVQVPLALLMEAGIVEFSYVGDYNVYRLSQCPLTWL